MKKFLTEYKANKVNKTKSENGPLGERVTVTTHHSVNPDDTTPDVHQSQSATEITIGAQAGTIRTEEYKRDLAEFQARRTSIPKEQPQTTPAKKKCGRHSLPISCTNCATDIDNTFNYEKKSAVKYKKHKRARSNTPDKSYEGVPNIQFLFQNQVFMPGGNMFTSSTFSEPHKSKRHPKRVIRSPDFLVQKLDFQENDEAVPPPNFFKKNSLPFDVKTFLEGEKRDDVDGSNAAGDLITSQSDKDRYSVENKDESGDDKLWEVMSELKYLDQWADEQLLTKSPAAKSDDSKSECSTYGLPIASACNLDVYADKQKIWNNGRWGVVPVQIKKLGGVTVDRVKKKSNIEINILRNCRHPNIILLMGLYPDLNNNVHIICERCVDSLFGVLHVQGRILTAQTAVQYTLDIANAMVFLQMQGYIHTGLSSMAIMITSHDTAKLADLGPCVKVKKGEKRLKEIDKGYDVYSPEPQYVNINDTRESKSSDNEPLLSANPTEIYLKSNAVAKAYESFQNSELFRWQAPELFIPGEGGMVHPCSKSDVYSLCLILWESCNASIPWKLLTYEALKEHYTLWQSGIPLPQDGTYPGCLLSLLQSGLSLDRSTRMDLETLQQTLQTVKNNLDKIGYMIIPARVAGKKSNFSSVGWDTTSPTDSECQSSRNVEHKAVVHNTKAHTESSSDSSDKDNSKSDNVYESIKTSYVNTSYSYAEKCFIDEENVENVSMSKYQLLPDKGFSSACSTPIAKIKARIKDIDTPGALHRSDSTEYCSILSPNRTNSFLPNDDSYKDQSSVERSTVKFSRSFTPKSYKPLHIKVPECNLDSIKPLLKDQNGAERSSYNFDIKNYSLPNTPIARSNKLRKNAWLSGEDKPKERNSETKIHAHIEKSLSKTPSTEDCVNVVPDIRSPESLETIPKSTSCSPEIRASSEFNTASQDGSIGPSPESVDTVKNCAVGTRRTASSQDLTPDTEGTQDRTPWFFKSPNCSRRRSQVDDDLLANVNVKPLVAIHEKWIFEANNKAGRSMSLPEENSLKSQISAVKPASHCLDTLQHSLPQLNSKKQIVSTPPYTNNNGGQWEQFCVARDHVARNINFTVGSPERCNTFKGNHDKGITDERIKPKTDQCTDTDGIEDFIRDLIRKEFQHLIHEITEDSTIASHRNEDIVNKGVSKIIDSLSSEDANKTLRKEPVKSFSRVKINGNNKPLLQITFNRSGENSLQVLDNCVNVTICDNGKEKVNLSMEDTLTDDVQVGGLKRCQAFNAIQEARSTEDLYIDDDLSTHMQENFGGRVKLIPLHGSLHEILCEKEDDCCLIKVKQENGCDTIYFRCDNSDTESRDAIDGCESTQDTVVFKRSISLIEERIQRVVPKEKRALNPVKRVNNVKIRPKSEIFAPIQRETRVLSNSSPSLVINDKEEVEVNIENVMCYQDSSSEECLKCQSDNDDFELLEKKIEEDIASNSDMPSLRCGCLGKISEENLASFSEDAESESN